MAQGILWFLVLNIVKLTLPLYMRKMKAMVFITALVINQNLTFKTITKLPMMLPTMQYVEQISPRSQRVIMKIGDGSSLFENMGEQVLQTPLTEIHTKAHKFKFDLDQSQLVPISESAASKILSPNK